MGANAARQGGRWRLQTAERATSGRSKAYCERLAPAPPGRCNRRCGRRSDRSRFRRARTRRSDTVRTRPQRTDVPAAHTSLRWRLHALYDAGCSDHQCTAQLRYRLRASSTPSQQAAVEAARTRLLRVSIIEGTETLSRPAPGKSPPGRPRASATQGALRRDARARRRVRRRRAARQRASLVILRPASFFSWRARAPVAKLVRVPPTGPWRTTFSCSGPAAAARAHRLPGDAALEAGKGAFRYRDSRE